MEDKQDVKILVQPADDNQKAQIYAEEPSMRKSDNDDKSNSSVNVRKSKVGQDEIVEEPQTPDLNEKEKNLVKNIQDGSVGIEEYAEMAFEKIKHQIDVQPLQDLVRDKILNNSLGMFVPKLAVVEDVDQFRYDVKSNRRINTVSVSRVFRKTGKYIFQLGLVNFLEMLIINLFLVLHCFNRENSLLRDY